MEIYKDEKFLEGQITQKVVAAVTVPIKVASEDRTDLLIENLNNIKKSGCDIKLGRSLAKIANEPHPDLMYGDAILVSTVVNNNDDVFLPSETWAARNTPINTPFNDDHVEMDIIGHIITADVLDREGNVVEADEPPDYFDIGVGFVVYKSIFPAIAKEIADKAPLGQKFVSMEARFNNFDYGLYSPQNKKMMLVARNDATAFLTKYLRVYGGEGIYQDQRIARVLRNFRFSGMGNVDTPANPTSTYKKLDGYEFASVKDIKKKVVLITKGKNMKVKKLETLEQAEQVIAELSEKLEQYEGEKGEALAGELTSLKGEKQTLTEQLTVANTNLGTATQKLNEANAEKDRLTAELTQVKTDLQAKVDELNNIQKAAKANERVAELKGLGIEVDDKKRDEIAAMSDSAFALVVDFAKKVKSPETTTQASLENVNPEKEKETDPTADGGNKETDDDKLKATAAKLADRFMSRRKSNSDKKKE